MSALCKEVWRAQKLSRDTPPEGGGDGSRTRCVATCNEDYTVFIGQKNMDVTTLHFQSPQASVGMAREREEREEVSVMEWITPDFEEIETAAEVTAYAAHL